MDKKMITIRMPKKDLKRWLAALRSPANRGKQGRGSLFDFSSGGYCCLGVAQAVISGGVESGNSAKELARKRARKNSSFEPLGYPTFAYLAKMGWDWRTKHGYAATDPWLPTLKMSAAHANDKGVSFAKLADAIEACSEGY